jgi:Holliday junction resolvase RusA-like endonuclease
MTRQTPRLHLQVALPHSVNGLYFVPRCARCGHRGPGLQKSFEARAYTHTWGRHIEQCAQEVGFSIPKGHPIAIRGTVYLADKRRDMPNTEKHLVDTIAQACGFDDRYVAELHLVAAYDAQNPRVELVVEELAQWPTPLPQ